MTLGLCCFGTVFRLHRYTHSRPQSPSFLGHVVGKRGSRVALGTRMRYTNLVYVHFNLFIDPTINSYTNPCNLASSRLLWVWLPCDKSHPREIRETGKDWFGKLSVPSLSRKFSSYTPLYAWRLCRLLFIVYKVNHFFSFFSIKKIDAWLVIDKRKYFLLESILCNSSSRTLSKSYYEMPGLRQF